MKKSQTRNRNLLLFLPTLSNQDRKLHEEAVLSALKTLHRPVSIERGGRGWLTAKGQEEVLFSKPVTRKAEHLSHDVGVVIVSIQGN